MLNSDSAIDEAVPTPFPAGAGLVAEVNARTATEIVDLYVYF